MRTTEGKRVAPRPVFDASVPIVLGATDQTISTFTANWVYDEAVTTYYLDVSTNMSFSAMVSGYSAKAVSNSGSCSVTTLTDGSIYYYRVRTSLDGRNSSVMTVHTSIKPPVCNVPPGDYYEPQLLSLSCPTVGTTLWYSFDDGKLWHQYSSPFTIDRSLTVGIRATKEGGLPSFAEYTYSIYMRIQLTPIGAANVVGKIRIGVTETTPVAFTEDLFPGHETQIPFMEAQYQGGEITSDNYYELLVDPIGTNEPIISIKDGYALVSVLQSVPIANSFVVTNPGGCRLPTNMRVLDLKNGGITGDAWNMREYPLPQSMLYLSMIGNNNVWEPPQNYMFPPLMQHLHLSDSSYIIIVSSVPFPMYLAHLHLSGLVNVNWTGWGGQIFNTRRKLTADNMTIDINNTPAATGQQTESFIEQLTGIAEEADGTVELTFKNTYPGVDTTLLGELGYTVVLGT